MAKKCFRVLRDILEPLKDYEPPKCIIDIGMKARRIVLWKETSEEQEIWILEQGERRLIEGHIGDYKIVIPNDY